MGLAARIVGGVERLAAGVADLLDRHPVPAWCVFSAFYFFTEHLRASRKPFWFDELVTVYVSRLPSMTDVWAAFSSAADAMPPLVHALTRTSTGIFGESEVSVRAPQMLAVWVMALSLYLFVRRHSPAIYAWMAATMGTLAAIPQAEDARGYGLLLGFSGVALVCWQRAEDTRRKWLWAGGLALSLAAAVSSHYYAGTVIAVLGVAELARGWRRGRWSWPVWGALVAGASCILIYLPGLRSSAAAYQGNAWSTPTYGSVGSTYGFLTAQFVEPLQAFLVMACAYWALRLWVQKPAAAENGWQPPAEMTVLVAALMAIPLLAVALGFLAHSYAARYAIAALIGFSVFAAYFVRSIERGGRVLPCLFVFAFAVFLGNTARPGRSQIPSERWTASTKEEPSLPIVVDDSLSYLQQVYYAPAEIKPRLHYLADPDRARRRSGTSAGTRGLLNLAPWAPLRVEKPAAFLEANPRFYLYGERFWESWLWVALARSGARAHLVWVRGPRSVYLVEQGGGAILR